MTSLNDLTRFIEDQLGRGGKFRSARQLGLAAGLNENAVAKIQERGRAEPETLIRLGEVLGKSPEEMFILAGWLPKPTDQASSPDLPDRRRLLQAFDAIGEPVLRTAVVEVAEALQKLPASPQSLIYPLAQTPTLLVADRPETPP